MRVEYINPFFQATNDVFSVMLSLQTKRGDLRASEELIPVHEANVAIGVTGHMRGSLLFSFPENMALQMVKIMSGMEMNRLDAFVTSALSEVANMISGNALTLLSQNKLICDISPPQIIVGKGGSMSMATEKAIVLPLQTDIGTFEISVSLHGTK